MTPDEKEQFVLLQTLALSQQQIIEHMMVVLATLTDKVTRLSAYHHTEIQA